MQDPEPPGAQVLLGARQPGQLAVRQVQGDRVDREVAPLEVLAQGGAELDLRQRARPLVALAPCAREIEGRLGRGDGGGAEAVVDDHLAARPGRGAVRHGHRVAFDHEVELVRRATQQQVAHGAADHIDGVLALERGDGG